jgi:MFS family permease
MIYSFPMVGRELRREQGTEAPRAAPVREGRLFRYAFTAALGGLLFGFDTAVISGTTEMIKAFFGMTDAQLGWAVSAALVGCVVGAIGVGRPGDRFGRRRMLFAAALLLFASALWTGAAATYTGFVLARFLGGLGVGAASVMAPMYIAEISPPRKRGRLVSTAQLAIVVGIVTAFFSNFLLARIGESSWRWMFWAEAVPAPSSSPCCSSSPKAPDGLSAQAAPPRPWRSSASPTRKRTPTASSTISAPRWPTRRPRGASASSARRTGDWSSSAWPSASSTS